MAGTYSRVVGKRAQVDSEETMTPAIDTPFCRLVGIEYPIVQAPIGGMAVPELAAAVSEAGALGMLSVTWDEPHELDEKLAQIRALTDRPFGVNMILDWPQEARLRQCVDAGVRIVSFFWGDPAPSDAPQQHDREVGGGRPSDLGESTGRRRDGRHLVRR
jgi:NAD(P)H-dependent flavin oxidoreductase YrpB (nitropropane dioxygenase family)